VLDQEEAKKFLMGKAEDKYNFFMKATELERVDRSFSTTVDTIKEMSSTNERSKDALSTTMEHVNELRRKWKEHQELSKLESKRLKCSAEMAWALYADFDSAYEERTAVSTT
jgi:structural maintenance of chromosomes protein 6